MHRPFDTPTPDLLNGIAARIAARPRLLAVALGGIAACGFQPLALWPLTIAAVAGLIALLARAGTRKRAALTRWLFGVGHFTVGNTWIVTAFTYQSQMPAWLGWIAVVALALYLAVYPALATLAAWELASRASPQRWRGRLAFGMLFAGCWIVAEWLRAWVFTGFAWNPLGIALLGPFDAPGSPGSRRGSGLTGCQACWCCSPRCCGSRCCAPAPERCARGARRRGPGSPGRGRCRW